MKKIILFVCVLLLSSLSLMAVKFDVEIGERHKNFTENSLSIFKLEKTIFKKTIAIEVGDCEEVNCEKKSGIGVDVKLKSLSEEKVQLYVDPYKRDGSKKKLLPGVWPISRIIDVGCRSSFASTSQFVGFPYGQKGKELTVIVSHKID